MGAGQSLGGHYMCVVVTGNLLMKNSVIDVSHDVVDGDLSQVSGK